MTTPTSFPLYDTLLNAVQQTTEEQTIDKIKLIKWIHSLDQDGKNKIYALIRYYDLNHDSTSSMSEILPFGGYFVNNELTFDLNRLPVQLQHLLNEFVKLHMKHMKDSQRIEKLRKKSPINK
jgi:hypothetical protein